MAVARFNEVERRVAVGDAEIAGTLTIPEGTSAPAVLLLAGTMADMRDGNVDPARFPTPPDPRAIVDLLADGLLPVPSAGRP